jgi:hypothetical protein
MRTHYRRTFYKTRSKENTQLDITLKYARKMLTPCVLVLALLFATIKHKLDAEVRKEEKTKTKKKKKKHFYAQSF